MKSISTGSTTSRSPRRLEVAIVAVWFAAGAMVGAVAYRNVFDSHGRPWFYQVDFGPAVSWACGNGFVVPDESGIPALADFLQSRTDRFSCTDLPPTPPLRRIAGAQPSLAWSHLMRSAALVWTLGGISWSGLAPLAGVFFGATVALTFSLFRLVAGRILSAAGALFVLTSPLYLAQLPQLRDYSKVPFMLALAWVMAQLISSPATPRRLLGAAAAYGAILGIGIGFRDDPLVTVPAFLLLLLVARPSTPGGHWKWKASALAVAAAVFLIVASPVVRVYANGGGASMPHAGLLGMMSPVDRTLGITNGSLYEVGYGLGDSYAAAVVSGYATRRAGQPQRIAGHSRQYDAASATYYFALASALPADALARAYASMTRVIDLPSSLVETEPPPYVSSRTLLRLYSLRSRLARAIYWLWPIALAAAFVIVSARSVRLAAILGVLCVYFTAYPAIQFNDRHILHLVLIPIASLLFTLQTLLTWNWGGSPRQIVIFAGAAALLLLAPLVVARWYQQRHVRDLIQSYLSAPMDHVDVTTRPLADERTALDVRSREADTPGRAEPETVATDYLIAEFVGGACDALRVSLTVRYDSSHAFADFTHRVSVNPPSEPGRAATVMFATFAYHELPSGENGDGIWYRFRGLELPQAQVPCLTRLSRLRAPGQFPVLLNATLPVDWERLPLYETVTEWESRPRSSDVTVYTEPADLHVTRHIATTRIESLGSTDVAERAPQTSLQATGPLTVDGAGGLGGPGPFTYLVRFKARSLRQGERLVAEGTLERGGLAIGLLKGGQWAAQLPIVDTGPFVAVMEVPDAGDYSLIIANNITGPSLRNHFELRRVGWVK